MQGLLEFPDITNSLSNFCDVSKGKFPSINKVEAKEVIISCNNPLGINIITCKHPQKDKFIKEVGGINLDINLSSFIYEELPSYIPILDLGCRNFPVPSTHLGITLHDIISKGVKLKAGKLHEQKEIIFRNTILNSEAFKNKKVLLFNTGSDTLIEKVWHERVDYDFFNLLKKMGFWAVGGFNFSVIKGECPFSHALNLKRSLYSCSLIEDSNLLSIPHVYAINKFHINKWIKWFQINQSIHLFSINCQLQKKQTDITQLILTVKSILKAIPYLHVILQGFHLNQIHRFGNFITRIHFTDKKPAKFAQCSRSLIFDNANNKIVDIIDRLSTKENLLANNILVQQEYIESVRHKIQIECYQTI
jgi:hypothetical protein